MNFKNLVLLPAFVATVGCSDQQINANLNEAIIAVENNTNYDNREDNYVSDGVIYFDNGYSCIPEQRVCYSTDTAEDIQTNKTTEVIDGTRLGLNDTFNTLEGKPMIIHPSYSQKRNANHDGRTYTF